MAARRAERLCTVVLHEDRTSTEDVLCGTDILSTGKVGLLTAKGAKCLTVLSKARAAGQKEISLHISLATRFGYENRMPASIVWIEDIKDATANHVEFLFRDLCLARADIHRMVLRLDGDVIYRDQKVQDSGSETAVVRAIYAGGQESDSALIDQSITKTIWRSGGARYTILIQLSEEMLGQWRDGDLMYERAVNGYLIELFHRWDAIDARHHFSMVLFGRTGDNDTEGNQAESASGSNDFYQIVCQDRPSAEWRDVIENLMSVLHNFSARHGLVNAAQGNMLHAIYLSALDYVGDNSDPALGTTGNSIIAVTAGTGIFECGHGLLKRAANLLLGNSIGVDIVALSSEPLHPVPLFKYQLGDGIEYALPHWADVSFWPEVAGHTVASISTRVAKTIELVMLPSVQTGFLDKVELSSADDIMDAFDLTPASVPDQRRFSFDASNYSSRPVQTSTAQHTGYYQPIATPQNTMQPPPSITSPQAVGGMYGQAYPSPVSNNYRTPSYNNLPPLTTPYGYAQPAYTPQQNGGRNGMYASPAMTAADQSSIGSRANSVMYYPDMDVNMQQNIALPVFDDEIALNRSPPLVLNEDFLASLFGPNGIIPDAPMPSPPPLDPPNPAMYNMPLPKLETDQLSREPSMPKLESMSPPILSGLDISLRESAITEKKRMRLIDLVNKRFTDPERMPDWRSREEIMDGSISDPNHVMGMKMLKTFMTSYWVHVHQQMPIMHRPTFNPETCPDLLMIAMMCLGASCIERTHDPELTQRCAEISAFLAYHMRWEVFKDVEFRPTAKLWTFQAMLLLELFEKMYSTRALHERAHIHHATTLTVMRRGSSLVGRSAINESPGNANDPTRTPPGPDGSINTSGVNTQDGRWNRWITAEATRRAAFAAFIIDSTHATLFGHSAVMSPHDIKLPLPCDEALWAATSSAEVQRVEASLAANGFKPTSFVDGLKRTLNGQRVRTNTFGRVILMAGLLNVSWHMNQRDLQVSSLGASGTLGNQMKWRAPLTRAFDFWRRDFDDSLSKNEHWLQVASSGPSSASSSTAGGPVSAIETRDSVFESRTCLHSLAHMAMHVDMIDCTVFAGSERALGRVVTEADRAAVTRRMREQWAPSARARDAVFYALRFLCEVLIPDEELVAKRQQQPPQPRRSDERTSRTAACSTLRDLGM
nr:hypothetical protein B0A51_07544 [Rachicladosporium sp. CCFEE 5018]